MIAPGDRVTFRRDYGSTDFVTPAFDDAPYLKIGLVTAVVHGKVHVWWDGSSDMKSEHDESDLRKVK
jgi:hypothetical protein